MNDNSCNECYVLWAYHSDRSGAKLLGVFESMEIPSKILKAQNAVGSIMQFQVRKMMLDELDAQDIFP